MYYNGIARTICCTYNSLIILFPDFTGYTFVCKIFCDQILQEAAVVPPCIAFATRQNPGFWEYVKVNANDLSVEGITATEYLKFKEMIVDESWYRIYCSFS